ncbi:uncharacterized protein LOC142171811 [Nicotiana tabacum]|uniref:Uncharacterized protein LOC142171811 n=1 Tax=Nicotiana tabacum TaxID=4097 RepID=A0AC58T304_TOBAC
MLGQGHLKELLSDRGRTNFAIGREQHQGPPKPPSPTRTIHIIIGGGDDASINSVKFSTTHKLKPLVITFRILDTDVRCIMVDDGSGASIIDPRVLEQMKLEDKIVPHCIMLTSFNNAVKRTFGKITLHVLADGITLETTFHIMNQDTTYNAIIGKPWIHTMRVIPSSLYQVIKFPTPWEIFSIRGEQRTSRECYYIALDSTVTQQMKDKGKEE